MMRNLMHWFS